MLGICGPLRAVEWSMASRGMRERDGWGEVVVVSLYQKGRTRYGVNSPQQKSDRCCSFTQQEVNLPKIGDRRDLRNGEMKQSRVSDDERNQY